MHLLFTVKKKKNCKTKDAENCWKKQKYTFCYSMQMNKPR